MVKVRTNKPEVLGNYQINLNGHTLEYTLRRSRRAKLVRFEIRRDATITITVPRWYNIKDLESIIKKKQNWLISKREEYQHHAVLSTSKEFHSGDVIPFLGKNLELVIQGKFDTTSALVRQHHKLIVNINTQASSINRAIELWYRTEANKIFAEMAGELSIQMGIHYNRLGIRGQRTRWGSCSRKGNLSFNWKLIMAPNSVINYVVVHELAHIKEMNHSPKFWNVVAEFCPRYRQHRKWLKDHDTELNSFLTC